MLMTRFSNVDKRKNLEIEGRELSYTIFVTQHKL